MFQDPKSDGGSHRTYARTYPLLLPLDRLRVGKILSKLARCVNGCGVYVCSHLRAQAMTRPIRAAHLFDFPRGGRKCHILKQRP